MNLLRRRIRQWNSFISPTLGSPTPKLCAPRSPARSRVVGPLIVLAMSLVLIVQPAPASAQVPPTIPVPQAPVPGGQQSDLGVDDDGAVQIDIGTPGSEPSQSVLLIVGLAILSLAPSLVIMMSGFTRIVIVLSLTRNALGLQGVPPNQVIIGLSLFLSMFVMSPALSQMNDEALQPYLDGAITQEVAIDRATVPVKTFMLEQVRDDELELMLSASSMDKPETPEDIAMTTLIPAFMLSELKTAFIIGFVIFIPFLIVDIVVAASLMSLGMMMLPPIFVSLPFKLLLFVMVGGWSLIVETLLTSFVVG